MYSNPTLHHKKHFTKECSKLKIDKITCFNCDGEHTANYHGCPTLLKIPYPTACMPKKTVHQPAQTFFSTAIPQTPPTVSSGHTKSVSYADIIKTHSSPSTEPADPVMQILIVNKLLAT